MDFDSFVLPPHGNQIVLDWIKEGKAVFQPGPLETPCLIWKKSKSKYGYGKVHYSGKTCHAHRAAINNKGVCTLHSCDNRDCVNPWHLSGGTYLDNTKDRIKKGRGLRVGVCTRCLCGRASDGNSSECRICVSIRLGRFCHCGNPIKSLGFCAKHYTDYRRSK